ncbi:hypothetical protein G9C98_006626 [Cotesia typhae]|uniref:Uncharacterized protein n=1 Tax=Cotesia typhae TaxID=2053667 RepID=A0A8J5V913_9HYME|nr:hypothetical protein G9C98_006626 [Cotesia typhae]
MVQKNILNKSMLNEVPKEEPIKVKHSKSSIMSEVVKNKILTMQGTRSCGTVYLSPFIIEIIPTLSNHGQIIRSTIPGLFPLKNGLPRLTSSPI